MLKIGRRTLSRLGSCLCNHVPQSIMGLCYIAVKWLLQVKHEQIKCKYIRAAGLQQGALVCISGLLFERKECCNIEVNK